MRRIIVVSDLHLGGRPDEYSPSGELLRTGTQICASYAGFIAFIDWLRRGPRTAGEELELVINGDLVDFLLEDDFDDASLNGTLWCGDEEKALLKFNRIVDRTRQGTQRGIFEALRDFLADEHRLTLLTGNHDVELALPAVRRRLQELLAVDGRHFQFLYDGEAYVAGRVLFEHGNRYDAWNQIDHSGLRQERSVLSRGLPVAEGDRAKRYFVPPPGTHLVIAFLNRIKARYRFVDLLKPENQAVIPMLLFLEPDQRPALEEIVQAADIFARLRSHGLDSPAEPTRSGDLRRAGEGLDQLLSETLSPAERSLFVEPQLVDEFDDRLPVSGDLGLRSAIQKGITWLRSKVDPLVETSRSISAVLRLRKSLPTDERYAQLHAALRRLNLQDSSFHLASELPEYLNAARETARAGGFDAVVYGHTHLPKDCALDVEPRPGCTAARYLNTGTWCYVLRLPESVGGPLAEARAELEQFVQALQQNHFNPYLRSYLCYADLLVDIDGTGGLMESHLYFFTPAQPRSIPFTAQPLIVSP